MSAQDEKTAETAPGATPPLDIVALDDDADFREFLTTVLETEGHAVRAVGTADALYHEIESARPDLVLLDMKMGDTRGEDVLAEIRQRWDKLAVIVVTGYPSFDSMRRTFKRDVYDYLAKPFSTEELRRTLSGAATELGLGQRPQDRLRAALGRQIRLARTERGWTLKELGEASGLSVSQLSSIERGAHLPSLDSLLQVAQALGASPSAWLASAGF